MRRAAARRSPRCSAVWELVVRVGWVDALLLPAPTEVAQSLWEDRSLLAPDLLDDHLGGRARAARRARRSARRSRVAMHLVPRGRPRAAAARGRLAGRADPGDRAADRARARLRAGAEDPDRRADLLLPGRRQRSPTGCATPTPTRASCCARWTPRAGSGCASWRRRRRCRPAFTGMKIAAAVAVIGAVLAEWAGSDSGLGHLLVTANGQLETRARVRRHRAAVRRGRRALRAVRGARAPRRRPGGRGHEDALIAACGARAAARRLRREGRAERATRPARQEPFTVMLDYFPNADHAGHLRRAGGRALRARPGST